MLLPLIPWLCACGRWAPADTGLDAPSLRAVRGLFVAAVWLDRDLGPGERIERLDEDGAATVLGEEGRHWIDPDPGVRYRWVGRKERRAVDPYAVRLGVDAVGLAFRGERPARAVARHGADLAGLPVALAVVRDGAAWLDPVCEDGEPCWSAEPGWWGRWDQGDAPAEWELAWWAEEPEPVALPVEVQLQVLEGEVGHDLCVATTLDVQAGRRLLWGDPHAHTNLSHDGCEDPEALCGPRGDLPGADAFALAAENGLDFAALTDHAEFSAWSRVDPPVTVDIREETLRLAAAQDGGGPIPLVGFEWTGEYRAWDAALGAEVQAGGHRTVLFDSIDPCEDFWVGATEPQERKATWGVERYTRRDRVVADPTAFVASLAEAAARCGAVRALSWFHHPALTRPGQVRWDLSVNLGLGDAVVEIYSEHGSSECFDLSQEGCAWQVDEPFHVGTGSVQAALQQGFALGFLAGTDGHDGRPGSLADGPGTVSGDADVPGAYGRAYCPGGLTGVLVAGEDPGRAEILDAIAQRSTLAASWRPEAALVLALGQDGALYLPGDDVPAAASPLRLLVRVDDPAGATWNVQLLDPWGEPWLDAATAAVDEPFDLAPGDVRYVRVRAWIDGVEQRLWASPFFGR